MIELYKPQFQRILVLQKRSFRKIIIIIAIVLIPLCYILVYSTGGIQYVYSHTMYLAIILGAFAFGLKGGIIIAIIGGLVLGPLMPIDTITGEMQNTLNWIFRLFMFVLIGGITGFFIDSIRKNYQTTIDLLTTHPETNIPLLNSLYLDKNNNQKRISENETVFLIRIINKDVISDLLGNKIYSLLLKKLHVNITDSFKNVSQIFQLNSDRLVVIANTEDPSQYAKELSKFHMNSIVINSIPIYIDITIGICSGEKNILSAIENAVYASRIAEKNHLYFMTYDEAKNETKPDLSILATFSDNLKNNKLRLVYQPIVSTTTMKILSFECLIRWKHDTLGEIRPIAFIPLIENTQLINQMTEWIILKTLNDIRSLKEKKIITKFAINISPNNLYNNKFFNKMLEMLKRDNGDYISFELTESAIMEKQNKITKLLSTMKDQNINISIDDFGTGYSSLSYLGEYPVDFIKIDKYFISHMDILEDVKIIVKSIITLAHSLNIKVIAEGIETKEQLLIATKIGCDYVQGFYIDKPLEYEEMMNKTLDENTNYKELFSPKVE